VTPLPENTGHENDPAVLWEQRSQFDAQNNLMLKIKVVASMPSGDYSGLFAQSHSPANI